MGDLYLWLKAGHVVSMVAWMAGLFYLPRLFVYHVEQREARPQAVEVFAVMERRLLKAIMTPAMLATWGFGLALVSLGVVDWGAAWPWSKAAAVLALTAFHMWCARQVRTLAGGGPGLSGRAYRMWNEAPTLLLVVIVVSVIVRPG